MAVLVVFWGRYPISSVVVSCIAFDIGFSKEQNCAVWEECGAPLLTRACLQNNSQVRREIGDDDNAANSAMVCIQESNNVSTHFLSRNGFDGNFYKANVKKVSRKSVTVQYSTERIKKFNKPLLTAISFMQRDDIITKMLQNEREELRKKLKKWMKWRRKSNHL